MVIYINERFILKKKYHTFFIFYKIEFDKKIYYVDGSVNVDIREEFKSRMEKMMM